MKKNKLTALVLEELESKNNFSQISKNINYDKYQQNEIRKPFKSILNLKFLTSYALCFFAIMISLAFSKTIILSGSEIVYSFQSTDSLGSVEECVQNSDFVFVGTIERKRISTVFNVDYYLNSPLTAYKLTIQKTLKGNIAKGTDIYFEGGVGYDRKKIISSCNTDFLKVGETYLFTVDMVETTSSKNRLLLICDKQKTLIKDYDITKSIENQETQVINTIKKYEDYLTNQFGG